MPAALYAISFKETGTVLAICSFEKQTLADADAARDLLGKLVDKHLTISSSSGQPIRVGLDELVLDPIGGKAAPADVIANPWGHEVQGGLANLGDGKEKQLGPAAGNTVDKVDLLGGGALTITLHNPDPIPQKAWVLFDGAPDPIQGTTLTNGSAIAISVTSVSVAKNTSYGLVILKAGVPATAAYVITPP